MSENQHRRNSIAGEELRAFIERVERLREEKKAIADDEKAVMAEAKARGFDTKMIRHCIKVRSATPSELEEARALEDLYLSALGIQSELPLFRSIDQMNVDITAKEQVIEALKHLVPSHGAIVVEAGGTPLRLSRDETGEVTVTEVERSTPQPTPGGGEPSSKSRSRKPQPSAPDCSVDEAEDMGREAAKASVPIIQNPFPFGDARRPRWDLGWRKESGNDGMGPGD